MKTQRVLQPQPSHITAMKESTKLLITLFIFCILTATNWAFFFTHVGPQDTLQTLRFSIGFPLLIVTFALFVAFCEEDQKNTG